MQGNPNPRRHGRRARCEPQVRSSRKHLHRPWFTALSTGWRPISLRAAERAVAPEGWELAQRPAGCVRVRRAVTLLDAARRSARGSTHLGLGFGVPVTVRAGAAADQRQLLASRTGTCTCTRATRACFLFVAMKHDAMRAVTRL